MTAKGRHRAQDGAEGRLQHEGRFPIGKVVRAGWRLRAYAVGKTAAELAALPAGGHTTEPAADLAATCTMDICRVYRRDQPRCCVSKFRTRITPASKRLGFVPGPFSDSLTKEFCMAKRIIAALLCLGLCLGLFHRLCLRAGPP